MHDSALTLVNDVTESGKTLNLDSLQNNNLLADRHVTNIGNIHYADDLKKCQFHRNQQSALIWNILANTIIGLPISFVMIISFFSDSFPLPMFANGRSHSCVIPISSIAGGAGQKRCHRWARPIFEISRSSAVHTARLFIYISSDVIHYQPPSPLRGPKVTETSS